VEDVHRAAEHQRAAADDGLDAKQLALAHGLGRDAAVAERAVEPDALDAALRALRTTAAECPGASRSSRHRSRPEQTQGRVTPRPRPRRRWD
jgi:hypothetical protein